LVMSQSPHGRLALVRHKKQNDAECWPGQGSHNNHCELVDTHNKNLPAGIIAFGRLMSR
jgi:hypothetical protein